MADFTQSYVGGPSGSPTQPIAPVQDDTTSTVIKGISSLFDIADKSISSLRKKETQASADKMLNEFAQEQIKLANAVELGSMSSREARTRMRKNYYSWISNNPSFQEDITKTHTNIVDKSGLGKIIMQGTSEEKTREDFWNKALGEGWGTIHDTDEQKEAAVSNYLKYQEGQRLAHLAQQEQENIQRELNMQGTRTRNQKADLDLRIAQAAEKSKQALGTLSDAYLPKFRKQVDQIVADQAAGKLDAKAATLQLNSIYTDIDSMMRSVGERSGTDFVNNLTKSFQDTFKAGQDRISGKLDNELYNNQVNNIMLKNKASILMNEDSARLAAKIDIFRLTELVDTPEIVAAIQSHPKTLERTVTQSNNPPPINDKGTREASTTFIKSGINTYYLKPENQTPKMKEELNTGINNMLEGVDVYERYLKNPKDLQGMVDFFSDRNVGKYIQENVQKMSPEAASNARTVIQKNYDQLVMPEVKKLYDGWSEFIEPVFTQGGIVFKYKDSNSYPQNPAVQKLADRFGVQSSGGAGLRAGAREAVAEANKKLAPLINKMVMTSAHLSGHTNYKQEYEALYAPTLFGVDQEVKDDGQSGE